VQIIRTRKYQINLFTILQHIVEDKITASENFQHQLDKLINKLPSFPYNHRESIYFDDKNIRDIVYKKYTINYEVSLEENKIKILNIFNKNKPID